MNPIFSLSRWAVAAAFAAGLAGGASAATLPFSAAAPQAHDPIALPIAPPQRVGPRDFRLRRSVVYAANENTAQVDGFSQYPPFRLDFGIYDFIFPSSVAVGPNEDVFVADEISSLLYVYAPKAISPKYTASLSGEAIDVEVAPNGDAYVSEYEGSNSGIVEAFKPGARRPFAQLSFANIALVYFMAFDARGDLYVDGLRQPGQSNPVPAVAVVPKGTTNAQLLPISIGFPGGLQVDRSGNLLVCDQLPNGKLGSKLGVYRPGTWKESRSFTIGPNGADALTFKLDADDDRLFTADLTDGSSDEFDYASGRFERAIGVPGGIGQRPGYGVTSVATLPAQF